MHPGLRRVRLSEVPCVGTRALEAGILEDRVHLFLVRIDCSVTQSAEEGVQVNGRLAQLDGIGLRAGCIRRRYESLRDRECCGGRLIITTAASERDRRDGYE